MPLFVVYDLWILTASLLPYLENAAYSLHVELLLRGGSVFEYESSLGNNLDR